jgi:hypothetical protein
VCDLAGYAGLGPCAGWAGQTCNDAATVGAYGITLVGSTTPAPAADVVRALLAACPVACAQCTATGR